MTPTERAFKLIRIARLVLTHLADKFQDPARQQPQLNALRIVTFDIEEGLLTYSPSSESRLVAFGEALLPVIADGLRKLIAPQNTSSATEREILKWARDLCEREDDELAVELGRMALNRG